MPLAANAPHAPRGAGRAGSVRAFLLAAAIHGLLLAFLYFGIRWQSRPPAPVEAELWSEPPRASAPAPAVAPAAAPEPPKPVVHEEPKPEPAPPKPDIAVKEDIRKPELKKQEQAKAEPRKDVKVPPQANDDPIRRELEKEELKRRLAREAQRDEFSQKAANESAALGQKATAEWNQRISAKVRSKVPYSVASAVTGNPEAVFEVSLLPGLEVGSVRMIKSSGNPAYDEAADRAIKAASPLPPPASDRTVPPRTLTLKMRPRDE